MASLTFKTYDPSNASRARKVRRQDWDTYRQLITELHNGGVRQEDICRAVNDSYNVNINISQLSRKLGQWDLHRYRPRSELATVTRPPDRSVPEPAPATGMDCVPNSSSIFNVTPPASSTISNHSPQTHGSNDGELSIDDISTYLTPLTQPGINIPDRGAEQDQSPLRERIADLVLGYKSTCSFIPTTRVDELFDISEQHRVRNRTLVELAAFCSAVQAYEQAFDVYFTIIAEALDIPDSHFNLRIMQALSGCGMYATTQDQKTFATAILQLVCQTSPPELQKKTPNGMTIYSYFGVLQKRLKSIEQWQNPFYYEWTPSTLLDAHLMISRSSSTGPPVFRTSSLSQPTENLIRQHITGGCSNFLSSVLHCWDLCLQYYSQHNIMVSSMIAVARQNFSGHTRANLHVSPPFIASALCSAILAEHGTIMSLSCNDSCWSGGVDCPLVGLNFSCTVLAAVCYLYLKSWSQSSLSEWDVQLRIHQIRLRVQDWTDRPYGSASDSDQLWFEWSTEDLFEVMLRVMVPPIPPMETRRHFYSSDHAQLAQPIGDKMLSNAYPERVTFSRATDQNLGDRRIFDPKRLFTSSPVHKNNGKFVSSLDTVGENITLFSFSTSSSGLRSMREIKERAGDKVREFAKRPLSFGFLLFSNGSSSSLRSSASRSSERLSAYLPSSRPPSTKQNLHESRIDTVMVGG